MTTPLAAGDSAPSRRGRAARGDGELLRDQILTTANDLLNERRSASAVSMRAIAEQIGVTTPSLYLHFNTKQELLDAVAAQAFSDLGYTVRETTQNASTPDERLRICGRAYVAFALRRPEHYRIGLMCRTATTSTGRQCSYYAVLQFLKPLVDDYVADRAGPASSSLTLTRDLWTTAHGVASLLIAAPELRWPDIPALVDRTLCAVLQAHAAYP